MTPPIETVRQRNELQNANRPPANRDHGESKVQTAKLLSNVTTQAAVVAAPRESNRRNVAKINKNSPVLIATKSLSPGQEVVLNLQFLKESDMILVLVHLRIGLNQAARRRVPRRKEEINLRLNREVPRTQRHDLTLKKKRRLLLPNVHQNKDPSPPRKSRNLQNHQQVKVQGLLHDSEPDTTPTQAMTVLVRQIELPNTPHLNMIQVLRREVL